MASKALVVSLFNQPLVKCSTHFLYEYIGCLRISLLYQLSLLNNYTMARKCIRVNEFYYLPSHLQVICKKVNISYLFPFHGSHAY